METIGAYEAKTHLSRLLDRIAAGERITITKYGIPVAVLQPPSRTEARSPEKVIAELRKFRKRQSLDGFSIREMIEKGRR